MGVWGFVLCVWWRHARPTLRTGNGICYGCWVDSKADHRGVWFPVPECAGFGWASRIQPQISSMTNRLLVWGYRSIAWRTSCTAIIGMQTYRSRGKTSFSDTCKSIESFVSRPKSYLIPFTWAPAAGRGCKFRSIDKRSDSSEPRA